MNEVERIINNKKAILESQYLATIKPLLELAISRNQKYGNSIAIVDDTSIVDLVLMKLCRTKAMMKEAELRGEEVDIKNYDEIGDSINYLVFLLMRHPKELEVLNA